LQSNGAGNIPSWVTGGGGGGGVSSVTGTSPITSTGGSTPAIGIDLTNIAALTASQTFSGTQTFRPATTGTTPAIVNGLASQTANLQEWQVNGSRIMTLSPGTALTFYGGASLTGVSFLNSMSVPYGNSGTILTTTSTGISESQITNLVSDLAAKAALTASNSFSGSQTFTPASSGAIPVTVTGASGQSVNLQVWTDSTPNVVASVSQAGAILAASTVTITNGTLNLNNANSIIQNLGSARIRFANGLTGIGQTLPTAGTGAAPSGNCVYISAVTTEPTANATGGGLLYVFGGALKYRGTSGTVTTIASA
jgi:hypothetical protein